MENLIKQQRRVTFSESGQRSSKEESVKDKKSQNWFQRQLYRQTSQDYDSIDSEFATAIAAATFAVHSFEEANSQYQKKTKTREESGRGLISRRSSVKESKEEVESSMRNRMSWDEKAPSFARALPTGNDDKSLTRRSSINNKVDDWVKAEMIKIQKRYEKSKLTILGWENEKKTSAKRRMEAKKNELEQRKAMNWQHYQNKLARIDHISGGAREQVEEKRRNEELKVKERAKKMKAERISSALYCFCC